MAADRPAPERAAVGADACTDTGAATHTAAAGTDTITVSLGERSYPIHIGPGLIDNAELLRRSIPARQVMIVTNEVVAPLYLDRLERALEAQRPHRLVLPDGEAEKNLETLGAIVDRLVAAGFHRDACLVALGGGVIGDITGFAAACYQRGIAFAQVPTTLLAQVDASVGGKTAVNHPRAKNMIGAFHQPSAVIADTGALASLPPREFCAGLAEVIKHGLILDEAFLRWLEDNMEAVLDHDAGALAHVVRRSCEIKAAIVAEDELERGRRALLNLGHTFGHALESLGTYRDWLHGEAVAVGIVMAARTSQRLGMIDAADCRRVEALLKRARLPITPGSGIDAGDLLRTMHIDKKADAAGLRMILLERLGAAVVVPAPDRALLRDVIGTCAAAGGPRTAAARGTAAAVTMPEATASAAPAVTTSARMTSDDPERAASAAPATAAAVTGARRADRRCLTKP